MGKYQSGQMGQTVNLLSFDFGGSNPSLPTKNCGSSSVDRALAFQAEGRGFEPRLPLSKEESRWIPLFLFNISISPIPFPLSCAGSRRITNKFWATNKLLPTIISDFIHLSPFLKRSIGEDTENYFFYNEHLFVCQLLNASYPIVYFAFVIWQTQSTQLSNE